MDSLKLLTLASSLALTLAISPVYASATHPTPMTSKTAAPATSMKITPAEIGTLSTIAAIDKAEIIVAVVASNKKPSSDVADYAKMMIEMHGDNLTQILEMANTLHALPLKGGETDMIQSSNAKDTAALAALSGDQFDKAYIDAMVKGHQGALNLIDTKLMKTAKSDEIKKFVTDTRAVVVQHLDAAKKIQDSMKS